MRLVEALIMAAGYKATRFHRQAKTPGAETQRPPDGRPLIGNRTRFGRSEHRIPLRRHQPVTASVLHHIAEPGEWEVEALNPHFVRNQHVIDLAPCGFGHS